jgi:hypothetical protein
VRAVAGTRHGSDNPPATTRTPRVIGRSLLPEAGTSLSAPEELLASRKGCSAAHDGETLRLSDIVLSKIYAADFVVNLNQRLLPRRPIPKTNISRGRRLDC